MIPLGIIYGFATFYGLKKMNRLKRPMRSATVKTVSQMFGAVDKAKETGYNVKEGIEDIVAEAQYENMKNKTGFMEESSEVKMEEQMVNNQWEWNNETTTDHLQGDRSN
ncbi:hypothetical protein JCM16358_09420 [Halanaerocella petrolearia]